MRNSNYPGTSLKAHAYAMGNVVCDCTVESFSPTATHLPVYYVTCPDCAPAPRALPRWAVASIAVGLPVIVFLAAVLTTI